MFKVNNRNPRTKCETCSKLTIETLEQSEICSKLTIKTSERRQTYFTPCSSVSIVDFKQVNAGWEWFMQSTT